MLSGVKKCSHAYATRVAVTSDVTALPTPPHRSESQVIQSKYINVVDLRTYTSIQTYAN